MNRSPVLLSVVSPCLNERHAVGAYLERVEAAVVAAGLADRFEVVIADGMSTDGTREWLAEAGRTRPWLRVVDNPEKRTPAARNAAIRAAQGRYLAIVDIHWEVDRDYFRILLPRLEDPSVGAVGGIFDVVHIDHPVVRLNTLAFQSPLATGAGMRVDPRGEDAWREVASLPGGVFRREVFERLGLFDPRLWRNQDDEFMYRLRGAGLKVVQNRRVRIGYRPRSSFKKLFRQYYEYGVFKRYALKTPGWGKAQLLPLALVTYAALAAVLLPVAPALGLAALAAYPLALASAEWAWRWRARQPAPVTVIWPIMLMQLGYGAGLWRGLFLPASHPLMQPAVIPQLDTASQQQAA